MIGWIVTLEYGRYTKYLDTLRNGFETDGIDGGDCLPDITDVMLRNGSFNMTDFRDRRDLSAHFAGLRPQNEKIIVPISKYSSELIKVEIWFEIVIKLPMYYGLFVSNGYDSMDIIKEIGNESELKDIGINNELHRIEIIKHIQNLNTITHITHNEEDEDVLEQKEGIQMNGTKIRVISS